jgi:hypothetical protein
MPMFHVEHMKMRYFTLILAIFALSACTKADPEAYKRDPILLDFQSQVANLNGQLETTHKEIETAKKDLKSSVPQSGQAGQFQKRIYDMQKRADALEQQIRFFKIHIESRARQAQADYQKAFKNNKEWPDKQEVESYMAEKRFRMAKMSWSQKDRIQEYKKNSSAPEGGESAGTHEAPPSGH